MPLIDISPDTHILEAMRRRSLTCRTCLREIIDNSFDAGATEVCIAKGKDSLTVGDNGHGVMDIKSMFALGAHSSDRETIGRYGVGFKDAAVWLANIVTLDSYDGLRRIRTRVNWSEIESSNRWQLNVTESPLAGKATYTSLEFRSPHRGRVRIDSDLKSDLAYDFSPGLRNGLIIKIDDAALKPVPHPKLLDSTDLDDVWEGRHFKLYAGVKADQSEPRRYGYDVAYLHRLILRKETRRAFGDYSALRFYGYLELLDDGEETWTLDTHKQDFEERKEFFDYLYQRIEPLLAKAEELSQQLEFDRNLEDVELAVSRAAKRTIADLRPPKPKQPIPINENGLRDASSRPRHRRRPVSDLERQGSVAGDETGGLIKIQLDEVDPARIGSVQEGQKVTIVHLNRTFPIIDFQNFTQVALIAVTLYANHYINQENAPNPVLNFRDMSPEDVFIEEFSKLLQNIRLESEREDRIEASQAGGL